MKIDFDKCVRQGVEQAMKECELKIGMTLKEAVEKQIPKKPQDNGIMWAQCPVCGGSIFKENIREHIYQQEKTHCEHCGQAIDWSEA